MSHYIHHVPGRLRVKCPALKRNEHHARAACDYVRGISGVLDADANPVTGSVLIKYDAARVEAATLVNSLKGLGVLAAEHGLTPVQHAATGINVAGRLTDRVLEKLLETALERSAMAVVAAII